MSRRKLNFDYQNEELSQNQGRCTRSRPSPMACVKCNKVFFDNVSLLLHFGSHLPGEFSISGQKNRDLASSQNGGTLSLSLPPCSSPSVERINEITSPWVNGCSRPHSLPVSSVPTDSSIFMLNSTPPINSSSDVRFNFSQQIYRSAMSCTSLYGSTSSSTNPFMYSPLGPKTFAYGSRSTPNSCLPEKKVGRARFRESRVPRNNQPDEAAQNASRDSNGKKMSDNNRVEEMDLTLNL